MRRRVAIPLLGLAALAAACGSDSGADTVTISGRVSIGGETSELAGAEVCVVNRPAIPCVQTGPDGRYEIPGMTVGDEALYRITHEQLWTFYYHRTVDQLDPYSENELISTMQRDAMAAIAEAMTGVPFDYDLGFLLLSAKIPDAPEHGGGYRSGVSFALSSPEASGPHYLTVAGTIDTSLTATDESGGGLFFNVPIGEQVVTSSFADGDCGIRSAWAGDAPGTIRMVARPDSWTYSSVNCGEP